MVIDTSALVAMLTDEPDALASAKRTVRGIGGKSTGRS